MGILEAVVLGLVQGLTEFLPVSSSGHLVLVPAILGWTPHGLAFDVLLHAGTLAAVVWYFRRDLGRMARAAFSRDRDRARDRRLTWLVVVGTVPAAVVGLLFADVFQDLFLNPRAAALFLVVTALALTAAEALAHASQRAEDELSWWQALLVGLAQATAIAPGLSRSGATIAAGLGLRLTRERAARFSFLLSVPVILVATGMTALDVARGDVPFPDLAASLAGFLTAALTGYLAIAGLLAYLRKRSLFPFAAYTATVGIAVLIWQYGYVL